MAKQLVNKIYWAPEYSNAFTLGASGSQVQIQANGEVHQHNDLMAPGDPIMFWHSHENYQFAKTVPQLPLLQQGTKYRFVIHGSAFPEQTVLYRVRCFGAQGHQVFEQYYRKTTFTFIYPSSATNYELTIVNAGATDYYFTDLELSLATVPDAANSRFWIQDQVGKEGEQVTILLLPAGRRYKSNFPDLVRYARGLTLLPIMVDNVNKQQLSRYLGKLLNQPVLKDARVVVTDARISEQLESFIQEHPMTAFMTAVRRSQANAPVNVFQYVQRRVLPIIKTNALEPDWELIFSAINRNWGGKNG